MTEADWMASEDPRAMLIFLQSKAAAGGHLELAPSDRKLRLFGAACTRLTDISSFLIGGVIEAYECSGMASQGVSDIEWATQWTMSTVGSPSLTVRAALLRDIFGNPWRPVRLWERVKININPDCLVPVAGAEWVEDDAAQSIARRIYDRRAFDDMPVLGDALEEAGCDNQDVLRHCRGLVQCPRCGGKGREDCMVDAGYNNPLMTTHGWRYCYLCNLGGTSETPGWWKPREPVQHVRGCWVIDLLTGQE